MYFSYFCMISAFIALCYRLASKYRECDFVTSLSFSLSSRKYLTYSSRAF